MFISRILIKMQEGDVKAVYIVEPISRNHKNRTNHSPSLKSVFGRLPPIATTYYYIIFGRLTETVLRGVDWLSDIRCS